MGLLTYGSPGVDIPLDDRTLAHVRVVVLAKLRRDEKFAMSWDDELTGRSHTIWLHPAIPLQFEFETSGGISLNRTWVEALTSVANSGSGLRLLPEPSIPSRV
ncbi:DUF7882 family protein [Subtercola boreus]|uniref:DUF7882 domain-containing protein n=1 Tax=Subtercola boreus TaxID=120213 RepID=A0A3E0WDD7_9MICO|nr:hypothetical protein [Subtercola boreus]RFA22814.1 hypothetical protein B7R24_04225 [Subtercola boreus]RFA23169.1 hypothetical protein B7R23_04220 [Subtercola boreus]RFA28922.1 hypothetical protein B7R25_04235 [Subtercola boreus]